MLPQVHGVTRVAARVSMRATVAIASIPAAWPTGTTAYAYWKRPFHLPALPDCAFDALSTAVLMAPALPSTRRLDR